ncbi:Bacterial type II/III secretion system short domain protein [Novipirellula artificiosorum]|uniref:Bacterial type II/III secretion system short domain protein n=1 Tax=Novipirellula artificiosorum TaxID=2528016 RepID=A0A5C6E592_9BACT|nr:Bacterial type II/III secretion system short domain protein [Novipirellula artificiosorum]
MRSFFLLLVCLVFTAWIHPASGLAQAPSRPVSSAAAIRMAPGVKPPGAMPPGAMPPGANPGQAGAENKGDEGKEETKKPEGPEPKVIRRDQNEDEDADPEELRATVGEDGRVAFQFRNQPWVGLVQWLAEISNKPLDWLELPGDRVNLSSPGRYTVAETRDLFNRYLLARGYVILELDGGLTVAKTESINPAIVPRVDPESLDTLSPHTFVRTSLDVAWLSAEKLSEELKPMISSNGRLTALTTTNRIEVMDAAINVQQIANLLLQERSIDSREALAPEFKLRYLPAEEAKKMLEEFLGVEKKSAAPMTPQQMQMMQQMRQRSGGEAPPTPEKKTEISIVANTRQNSVIIRAPEDRVMIASEFIKRIDVPSQSVASLSDIESRIQVYRLASLDPEKLVDIVGEMNILEPSTRIRVDEDNNALIVSGSPADRFIIQSLIERLDGSGRSFQVLQLRRLDAGEVTESIAFLMGQKNEDDKNSRNQRYSWYGYGNEEEEEDKDEFRVAANSRYRQVLLWANPMEMEQVESLLIKLGELPPPGGSDRTIRVIDASATPETLEYLKRLKRQWSQLAPNPLELPETEDFIDPNRSPTSDDSDATDTEEVNEVAKEADLANSGAQRGYRLTAMQSPELAPEQPTPSENPTDEAPPIRSSRDFDRMFGDVKKVPNANSAAGPPAAVRIELDPSGNLVLSSSDTKALDRLEDLMLQISPPKRPYHVFKIKHATAYWMRLNLEEYFEDEDEKKDSASDSFYRYYWDIDSDTSDDGPTGLGKGNKMRFIDDADTSTLVVTGATSDQLRTIADLIDLWDTEEPANKRKSRYTKLVSIRFGKADKIAETVKEAYRDLLSSNDKTFQGGGKQGASGGPGNGAQKNRDGGGSGFVETEGGRDGGGADFSFKGKLSLGVDSVGNSLLVSTEGEPLLELVCEMIEKLDDAARPSGEVQVVELPAEISGESLQNALRAFGVDATSGEQTSPKSTADMGRNARTRDEK